MKQKTSSGGAKKTPVKGAQRPSAKASNDSIRASNDGRRAGASVAKGGVGSYASQVRLELGPSRKAYSNGWSAGYKAAGGSTTDPYAKKKPAKKVTQRRSSTGR